MKNLKSVLMNVGLILVAVLALVFMSQSFYGYEGLKALGYDFLELEATKYVPNELILVKASVIINIIVLSLMMLVALVNLLVCFNVIKSAKVAKILNLANVVLAVLFLVFAVCAVAGVASFINKTPYKIGWAVVLVLVLSVIAVAVAVLELLWPKKKK